MNQPPNVPPFGKRGPPLYPLFISIFVCFNKCIFNLKRASFLNRINDDDDAYKQVTTD